MVISHLDNSTPKAYLCNQGDTALVFPTGLACGILNVVDKHGITFIQAYIPTHLNLEADYLSVGFIGSGIAPAPSHSSGYISSAGSNKGGFVGI